MKSSSVPCGTEVCPAESVCGNARNTCVSPEQALVCIGMADGERCTAGKLAGICDQALCIPGCGDGVQDDEEDCDDGNHRSHDGCSSACVLEALSWEQWADPWIGLGGLAAAYHTTSKTLVAFGGFDDLGARADHWERDLDRTWRQPALALRPKPRLQAAVAYDSVRGVTVVFGGFNDADQFLGDTWEYDGTTWAERTPATSPAPRRAAAMAFDSTRNRMVLFGGFNAAQYPNDTWEYDAATHTWTEVTLVTHPSGRAYHSMVWEPLQEQIVMVGGYRPVAGLAEREWRYDGTTRWIERTTSNFPDRRAGAAAFLPGRGVVVFGGIVPGGNQNPAANDTWELNSTTNVWTQVTLQVAPPPRQQHVLVHDSDNQVLVLIGGTDDENRRHDDVWEYAAGKWIAKPARTKPRAEYVQVAYHASAGTAIAVSPHLRLSPDGPMPPSDTWLFDTTWRHAGATAAAPWREFSAIGYDAVRDRSVLFGGTENVGNFMVYVRDTTWEWDGTRWTEVAVTTKPSARIYGTMTQAGPSGGILMFGGLVGLEFAQDTWVFDATGWREVVSVDHPGPHTLLPMAFDPTLERVVALDRESTTWIFENGTWSRLPTIESPPARDTAALAFHADRERVILYGGQTTAPDLWELDMTGPIWRKLEVTGEQPVARRYAGFTYHMRRRALLLFGGATASGAADDTWLLGWRSDPPNDEDCTNGVDDDGDKRGDDRDPDCMRLSANRR